MKKVLALVMALLLVLSLAACGVLGQASKETVSLGKTVSTDIVDFTLKDAQFSYYASSHSTTFAEPIDKDDNGILHAAKGRVLVCMTFDIKNNDRDTLDVGLGWRLQFKVKYNGKEYSIYGYDLNDKNGSGSGISLAYGAISNNGGSSWKKCDTGSKLVDAGEKLSVRVVSVAQFEPDSLNDPFEITVNIPKSTGMDYFTYTVS